jgi:hypothetical protein
MPFGKSAAEWHDKDTLFTRRSWSPRFGSAQFWSPTRVLQSPNQKTITARLHGQEVFRDCEEVFPIKRKAAHASCGLRRDFISFPVLKKGTTFWPTETRVPVRGFLPARACRIFTKKLPNPRSSTRSPRAIAEPISAKIVFTSLSAC